MRAKYAKLDPAGQNLLEIKTLDDPVFDFKPGKNIWMPVVDEPRPPFDQDTQTLAKNDRAEPLPFQAGVTEYRRGWTVVDLDAAALREVAEIKLRNANLMTAIILLKTIKILIGKAVLAPTDFDAETRAEIAALQAIVDRIRP